MLLFVAYQLWGTGIQHAQAQNSLEDEFLELLDSTVADEAQEINTAVQASQDVETGDADGSDSDDGGAEDDGPADAELVAVDLSDIEYTPQFLSKLYPEDGTSLARIVIEDINVDQIVVEGVSVEDLRKGPGHYGSTPNPGQEGNAAIAGHRTTYGAPFHRIDELDPGAEIVVTTLQGTFVYRVKENVAADGSIKGHFIVSPSDTWVLAQGDENLLTLTACHPKYSARQRIIVQAELVGEPAPTIPRDGADDLAPVEISAGAEDERASEPPADADDEGSDLDVVISDEVAADDDPSVDAEGNEVAMADAGGADADAEVELADQSDAVEASPADDGDAATDEVELTAAQTPFDDPDDFGEGLNGDRSKIKPAILWGLAGLSIWMAVSFIGRRLGRKWTMYAIGLTPFALVLWSAFVNVDQALPSY